MQYGTNCVELKREIFPKRKPSCLIAHTVTLALFLRAVVEDNNIMKHTSLPTFWGDIKCALAL